MKIISLRLKNINALKGEWKIDFSQEPFASSGLFAITGPTGAGKTTLLDAICLALYQRTPRLNEPSPADKVMTRHTGECLAEVEFEVKQEGQNKRFRAFWEVRRARGVADGKLQPAKVELAEVDTTNSGQGDKIIADKVKDKDSAIARLTGLDFGRFTKSMLLAQGGFAAFLNANAGERADLLEELTGTEIYGQISVAVFERFKDEESKLTQLRDKSKNVDVLDAEAMEALTSKQQQCEASIQSSQQQRDSHQKTLALIDQFKKADLDQQQAQVNTQHVMNSIEARKTDLNRLANSAPANKLRPIFSSVIQEQAVLTRLTATADTLKLSLKKAEQELQALEPQQKAQQKSVEVLTEESTATNRLMTEKIIPLDEQIKQHTHAVNEFRHEAQAAEDHLVDIKQQTETVSHSIQAVRDEKAVIEAYLTKNSRHQHLHASLPLWQAKFLDREKWQQKVAAKEALIAAAQKQAAELSAKQALQQQAVQNEEAELAQCETQVQQYQNVLAVELDGETPEAVKAKAQKKLDLQGALIECKHLFEQYQRQNEQQQKLQQQLKQKKQSEVISLSAVEQLRKDYQQQKKLIAEIETSVKLEQDIANLQSYRDKLQVDDACPLCGSTQHPAITRYRTTSSSESEAHLVSEKLVLESVAEQGAAAKDELVAHQTQSVSLEESIADIAQSLRECVIAWEAPARELDWTIELADVDASVIIPGLLEQAKEAKQQAESCKQKIEFLEQQFQTASKAFDDQKHQLQNHCNDTKLLLEQQAHTQKQSDDYSAQLKAESVELKELESTLAQQLQAEFHWLLPSLSEQQQWLQQREKESVYYQQQLQDVEQTKTNLMQLEHTLAALQQQQIDSGKLLAKNQTKLMLLTQVLKQLTTDRRALFGDKNTSIERQRLSQCLGAAEAELKVLVDSLSDVSKTVYTLQAQLSDNAQAISDQQINTKSAQHKWQQALAISPFTNEASFTAALLDDDEQLTLSELKQTLDAELVTCTALQQKAEQSRRAAKQKIELDPELQHLREVDTTEIETLITIIAARLQQANDSITTSNKQLGEIEQVLRTDQQKREQQKTIITDIEKQEQQYDDWDSLKSLVGSADGKRFRVFAQGLTLDHLIHLANDQLTQLHNRYQLERKVGEALELQVIDTWQADAVRDTKTLSGGESFLVSLALALALSDLVSHKTKIDSLFLDEGFGTLDRETLDIALDALDNLNASGKMIGVISHVEALKERIPVQIEIKKMSGLGVSQLDKQFMVKHLAG